MITVNAGGKTFRYAKGSFIAVWDSARAQSQVPDDMIQVPSEIKKFHVNEATIRRIAAEYLLELPASAFEEWTVRLSRRELALLIRALDKKIWSLDHVGMSDQAPVKLQFRELREKIRGEFHAQP